MKGGYSILNENAEDHLRQNGSIVVIKRCEETEISK
jgi:predicted CoA-binding protein